MNNYKKKLWPIIAVVIFVITVLATATFLMKVAGLNMLPMKYMALAVLAVVFLLLIIFTFFFLVPEQIKNIVKYFVRVLGIMLTVSLLCVDVVGIQMINKFEETMSQMTGNGNNQNSEETEEDKDTEKGEGSEAVDDTQTETEEEETPFGITKDPFIFYISGFDTAQATTRANSDVNIMAVINPSTKQILLLNTPRDFYIPISASPDGALDKLTHCGGHGIDCSMETLSDYYDVDIKYYGQINFTGFKRLVDAMGGITVYAEKEFDAGGIHFQKGANEVDGEKALAFVRERKQFGRGDLVRGEHQMAVIKGMIKKMLSPMMILQYGDILDSMGEYFRTSISQEEIAALVKMQLSDLAEWNIQMYAVSGESAEGLCYSMPNLVTYVMIPDEATVAHGKTLIQMVMDGKTITAEDLVVPSAE